MYASLRRAEGGNRLPFGPAHQNALFATKPVVSSAVHSRPCTRSAGDITSRRRTWKVNTPGEPPRIGWVMTTTALPPIAPAMPAAPPTALKDDLPGGLTSNEAGLRLQKYGPNAMPDTSLHPVRRALWKFWAPVPWMLEAAIVFEIVLADYVQAGIIAGLLLFNAGLGLRSQGFSDNCRVPERA